MNDKAMSVRTGARDDAPVEAHLWVCSGKNVGRRYHVDAAPRILGRAVGCDIVVEDARASQRHARIRVEGGRHVVEDLGSTNGTFVNNQRVSESALDDGDLLQVGETIFEYLAFDERAVGSIPGGGSESDPIPEHIRSGAQQMLQRVRQNKGATGSPGPEGNHPGAAPSGVPGHPTPPGSAGGNPPLPHAPYPGAYPNPPGGAPPVPAPYPPGAMLYPQHAHPYALGPYGGYPPGPPGYAGQFEGYYDDEEDEEEEEKPKPNGSGIDIIDIILRVKHVIGLYVPYWPMAVAFVFVGVMLGALHFKLAPPPKTAVFQILLRPTGTSGDIIGQPGFTADRIQFFPEQVGDRFMAAPIIEEALERIDGKRPSEQDISDQAENIEFSKIGQFRSDMFGGRIKAETGEAAVRYLNTHLGIFLEREIEMGLGQVKADVQFFSQEDERAARTLEETEKALAEYKASHPDALPRQAEAQYTRLFSLQQQRSTLQGRVAALEASIRENRRQLAKTEKLHTTSFNNTNPYRTQISNVNTRIATARAAGKGDDHPDIKRLQAELEELKQLARDRKLTEPAAQVGLNQSYSRLESAVQTETARLRALREELREVDRNLEQQNARIQSLPKAEAEYQELARAYEAAQKAYEVLLEKLKNAELHLERERTRADAQYQLVVAPRVEHKPAGKTRLIRLAGGGIGGLFLAFTIATVLLVRGGRLTLALLVGREVDLSALFAKLDAPPSGPGLSDGGSPEAALPAGSTDREKTSAGAAALPAQAGDVTAGNPESETGGRTSAESTDILEGRKRRPS